MKIKKELIYCYGCNKWLKSHQWYLPDGDFGRVCCLEKDCIVGYTKDEEYKKLFENE